MNFIRLGLYTALALVTYLMLLKWQEDYPQTIEQASAIEPVTQSQLPQIAQTDVPAVTALTAGEPAVSADVPSLPAEPRAEQTVAAPETLVTVKTETFVLSINTVGGDIEYLALPKYLKALEPNSDPFVILSNAAGQTYTAPSGLIGRDGIDSDSRARYRVEKTDYVMGADQQTLDVDLTFTTSEGVDITKRFSFAKDSYAIDVTYLINNQSASEWRANAFGQIKRSNFDDPSNAGGFGRTYLGFVSTTLDDPYYEIEFDDIDEDGANTNTTTGGWIAFSQHYFISAWIPNDVSQNNFTTRKNNAGLYFGEFTSDTINVPQGQTATYTTRFYAGPKDQYKLAEISEHLDLTIDYSFLWFLAAPIYWLLTQINQFIGNYGFSIILLTVSVKALFYKLSETQYRSMAGMRRIMPKMQKLKENYGDDRMKMQQATMELYKKEKINPFGGCLPMLVQMPVFIALYWVLLESVELRHAPFMLWLTDLSVKDPYFILPLLMGGTMYLQTSLSPAPADPMQAKVMKLMPIMMTGIFLWFPAGLVLYWFTNAALGIIQQWYITRKIEAQYEAKKA
jgi:YidC/Oxa1 family membrane protein insertase